jgi:23S rRNA pseudouridine2605 synthase
MMNEESRENDSQKSNYPQTNKRKRISTSSKGYEKVNYNPRPREDSQERKPLYSSDRSDRKPYREDNREGFDKNERRPFVKKSYGAKRDSGFKKPYGKDSRRPGSKYDNASRKPWAKGRSQPGFEQKQPFYNFDNELDKGPIRLNKYIANTGLCSRREADEYIQKGLITVNGQLVTELGTKVQPSDEITYNGQKLQKERKVYILLNKPKDFVTSVDDPHAKQTVMELVKGACRERIYPVGRLDRMTTGVLLLTNDGELTKKLTHPTSRIRKIYQVSLDKEIKPDDMQTLTDGVTLSDGFIKLDGISYISEKDNNIVGVEIHSGRNRVIRRIFEQVGYKVIRLDRIFFAGLTKKGLTRGKWRYLAPKEVGFLKMLNFNEN